MKTLTQTINKMMNEAKEKNYEIFGILPFDHPDDYFMIKCVIMNEKREIVSYIYNRGFQSGNYCKNLSAALTHMKSR